MNREQKVITALMVMVVIIWGMDYVIAKLVLELLSPLCLLFFKYVVALALVLAVKLKTEGGHFLKARDLPVYVASVILGEIIYFYSEYTAMSYLPVSIISIIIAFIPAVSAITERILYKKRTNRRIVIGIAVCLLGIALIVGIDVGTLMQGRMTGYLLAFACVFSWNAYNFITVSLHRRYGTATLTANQLACTVIMLAPYVAHNAASLPAVTPVLAMQVLFLGVFNSGIGFLVVVRALHVLGPTTTMLFSNFMPVTTTFFGWLILKETIAPVQMAGGALVVAAAYAVIKEKGRMEALTDE